MRTLADALILQRFLFVSRDVSMNIKACQTLLISTASLNKPSLCLTIGRFKAFMRGYSSWLDGCPFNHQAGSPVLLHEGCQPEACF